MAAAQAGHAEDRKLAQRRRRHLELARSFPPSTSTIPTSRSSSRRPRRRNTTPRSTRASPAAPPAISSPAVRSTPRSTLYQEEPARQPQRPEGHGQFFRRRQIRLADRRRQDDVLRADGLRHPRLHLQQGRLDKVGADRAEDDGGVPRRARQAQEGRHLHAARARHRRPVGGRDDGLPEHRPQLLEGRDRPRRPDRGQGEVHRPAVCRGV